MTRFPKILYVYNEFYDEDDEGLESFACNPDKSETIEMIDDEQQVAIYQLVKIGKVKESKKIVFE